MRIYIRIYIYTRIFIFLFNFTKSEKQYMLDIK